MPEQNDIEQRSNRNRSGRRQFWKGTGFGVVGIFGVTAGISPLIYGLANMLLYPGSSIPFIEAGGGASSVVLGLGALAVARNAFDAAENIGC